MVAVVTAAMEAAGEVDSMGGAAESGEAAESAAEEMAVARAAEAAAARAAGVEAATWFAQLAERV